VTRDSPTTPGHILARRYHRTRDRLIAAGLAMLCGAWPTDAASLSLLTPLNDFALRDPAEAVRPGSPVFYDATGPDAGWHIVQWDIPGGRLPPFLRFKSGDVEVMDCISYDLI
jgi:hypothetical protein